MVLASDAYGPSGTQGGKPVMASKHVPVIGPAAEPPHTSSGRAALPGLGGAGAGQGPQSPEHGPARDLHVRIACLGTGTPPDNRPGSPTFTPWQRMTWCAVSGR